MIRSTGRSGRRLAVAAAMLLTTIAAGCSSSSEDTAATTTSAVSSSTTAATADAGHTCDRKPAAEPVDAETVADAPNDRTITSFDGTEIRIHWFPAPKASKTDPAPVVLMGPGWSQPGSTSLERSALFGALGIGGLNDEGYNVLTWDPRGFGQSGGLATVDSPDEEGRDVEVLLDWIAEQPEVRLDRPGDARVGMAGWSYGGGIQFVTAAQDCRVDVLAPGIAWNSLITSLGKAQTFKEGWSGLLMSTAGADNVDPQVNAANAEGKQTGRISQENQDWFAARGPGKPTGLIDKVDVPTLLIQGTADTLFTLDEAISNYDALRKRDIPVKMLWFCGGHGSCLVDPGDPQSVTDATMAWFARYLRGDTTVDTGPALDVIDQDGTRWTGDAWPPKPAEPLTATGRGTLALKAEGGAGPSTKTPAAGDVVGMFALKIMPGPATNSVDVAIEADAETLIVGAPKLILTYQGTVAAGERPERVFAQLVDPTTGVVLGNQITPIEVTLDGQSHTTEVDLEVVAHHLAAGGSVTLQVVATTVAYAQPRLGGTVDFTKIAIELPTTVALKATT